MASMPFAITLPFERASAVCLEDMWRTLAEQNIDRDRHQLDYAPHITLAIYLDKTSAEHLASALERIAPASDALPVTLVGFGIFPGETSILWAVPVVTSEMLACHAALQAALPGLEVHPHYRLGLWVPHVTLSGALPDPAKALAALTPLWRPLTSLLSRLELVHFRPVEVLKSHAFGKVV